LIGEHSGHASDQDRNLAISNGCKAVHPIGHPMSHSLNSGFKGPPSSAATIVLTILCAPRA